MTKVNGSLASIGNSVCNGATPVTCGAGKTIVAFGYTTETNGAYAFGASFSGLHNIGPFACSDGSTVATTFSAGGALTGGQTVVSITDALAGLCPTPSATVSPSSTTSPSTSASATISPTISRSTQASVSVSGSVTASAPPSATVSSSTSATATVSASSLWPNVAGLVTSLAAWYGAPAHAGGVVSAGTNVANPYGIVYAADQDMLFVTNVYNHLISSVNPWTGAAALLAGSGSAGRADGTGSSASFNTPVGIAYDAAADTLFIAEEFNHLIRIVATAAPNTGEVTTLAGGGSRNGNAAGCVNGVGSAARFYGPRGMTLRAGVLYVADLYNDAVRTVTVQTATVATLAGACGLLNGFSNGIGTNAYFASPQAVELDGPGTTLYVADQWNNLVRNVSIATGAVGIFAGGGGGRTPTPGNWGFQSNAGAGLSGSGFHSDGVGNYATFWGLQSLTYDGRGNLLVGDSSNALIRSISLATGAVITIAGGYAGDGGYSLPTANQQPGYGWVDGLGTAASFRQPIGIASDGAGHFWVADYYYSVIRFIGSNASPSLSPSVAPSPSPSAAAPAPLVAGVAGTVTTLVAYPNGALPYVQPSSLLVGPQGVVLAAGTLYVSSTANHRLLAVNPWTGASTLFAGSAAGSAGYTDSFGTAALFSSPTASTYDGVGVLYVSDYGNHLVRAVALASARVSTLAGYAPPGGAPTWGYANGVGTNAAFLWPQGIAFAAGVVYLSDSGNCLVRAVSVATRAVTTVAGGGGRANSNAGVNVGISGCGYANGIGSNAMFDMPMGVAADGLGRLYVADRWNNVVRSIVIATQQVSLLAGGAAGQYSNFLGPGAFQSISYARLSHADGVGTAAGFWQPNGVVVDGRGNLIVIEYQNCLVRSIALSSAAVTTVAGGKAVLGGYSMPATGQDQPGYGWADGLGTSASFTNPFAAATDGSGNLWIADSYYNAIRYIGMAASPSVSPSVAPSPSPSAAAPPLGVVNGAGIVTSLTTVLAPMSIAYAAGMLYVSQAQAYSTVKRVTTAGAVYPFVGAYGVIGNLDGVGSEAQFYQPFGLAYDGVDTVSRCHRASPTLRARIRLRGSPSTVPILPPSCPATHIAAVHRRPAQSQDPRRQPVYRDGDGCCWRLQRLLPMGLQQRRGHQCGL